VSGSEISGDEGEGSELSGEEDGSPGDSASPGIDGQGGGELLEDDSDDAEEMLELTRGPPPRPAASTSGLAGAATA